MNLFMFILLGVHWALGCMYSCLSSDLGTLGPLFFQIFFFCPFVSLFFFRDSYDGMLAYLMLSNRSLRLCSYFFILFFFFLSVLQTGEGQWYWDCWSSVLPAQTCCWIPLESFSFQFYTFQLQNFCLVPFYNSYLLTDILIFFRYCFPDSL